MKRNFTFIVAVLCACLCVAAASARAEVTVPPLFGDHSVLQRDAKAPVWGKAKPGEKVTVSVAGKDADRDEATFAASAKADEKGDWKAEMPKLPVGGPYTLTITGEDEKALTFNDVMVGDVWLCSGQSNMDWSVTLSNEPEEEIAGATDGMIRLYQFPHTSKVEPSHEVLGEWKVTSPQTIPNFSAVGYFFARELRRVRPEVPVGLIQCAWGGMPAESFMSREMLETRPEFKPILDRKETARKGQTDAAGKPVDPNAPFFGSNVYNGQVLPLVPYAISGAIWYQGESNAGRAEQYRTLFPAMIEDWRKQWTSASSVEPEASAKDFPFLFVQLANFMPSKPEPGDSAWAELREAQLMTLEKSKNTGMAVIIDVGDAKDIHPKNKQDVGKRLALAAEHLAYGDKEIIFSGPIYKTDSMKVEDGGKVKLTFNHTGGGLTAKGGDLKGFAIAGDDKKFVWADAKIDGKSELVVWSKDVPNPKAVRYAWADNPDTANLCNAEGLPASPFRTDDWPLTTAGKN